MERKLKIGIIGTGRIVLTSHLPILNRMSEVEIIAISDVREESLKKASKILGNICRTFIDYHDVLKIPEIHAVIIATPAYTHKEITLAAFQAGKHVFCEKPLALDLKEVNEILRIQQSSGKLLQVGYVCRYSPLFRKMREIISEGTIGKIHMMWVNKFRAALCSQWTYNPKLSGGAIVEENCHQTDIFNWMLESLPKRVVAFGGQNVIQAGKTVRVRAADGGWITVKDSKIVDNAWVIAEYENNARASIGISFFCPHGLYGDHVGVNNAASLEMGAIGDRGSLMCYGKRNEIHLWSYEYPNYILYKIRSRPDVPNFGYLGTWEQFEEFVHCVLNNRPTFADGEVAKLSLLVPLAAEKSIKEGKIVEVKEIYDQR